MNSSADNQPEPDAAARDILRHGVVLSRDAAGAVVDLGDGMILGPMGWSASRAGRLKIYCPPTQGEQVEVLAPEGDLERAYISRSLFSDANPAPATDDSTRLEWDDGTFIAYDAGTLDINVLTLVRIRAGRFELVGPVDIEGDVQVEGKIAATGDVTADTVSLKNHLTTGVQPGPPTSLSGKPKP